MAPEERARHEGRLRRAVLAGDERAWQTLYDGAYVRLAAYIAWRCAGMRDRADEITQETWLIAVRRIRDFDPATGSFLGWLRGIAANVIRNQLRKRRRHEPLTDVPDAVTTAGDEAEQVALALADLPKRYEAVLRAKYLDGASVDQIAFDWSETPKAIESLLSRAREAFRAAYMKEETSDPQLHEAES